MTHSYHLVVVATELVIGMALEMMIRQLYPSASISVVATGLEVLALDDQTRLDLVLSTPNTGVIDSLALTRALRARNDTLPIILISPNRTLEEEANKAGVTLFLYPPELAHQLKMALPELLTP